MKTTAPDILKDARQLFVALRKTATKTKVENLDKLWEVLEAIREDGGRDYSAAEVGRRLEGIGGLATQSLRNRQGAHYREIISTFANAVNGSNRYVAKNKSNVEQALDLITDPSIRAVLRTALNDAKRLKVVNDNLHAAFKTLQVGASLEPKVVIREDDTQLSTIMPKRHGLTPRLIAALRKGIDETRLAQQGLHIGEDGGIVSEAGDQIFPPAFVSGVRAVLTDLPK